MHNGTEPRRLRARRALVAGAGTAALVTVAALAHAGTAGADDHHPTTTQPPTTAAPTTTEPAPPTTAPPVTVTVPAPPTTLPANCEEGETVHVEVPDEPEVTVPPGAICVLPATPIEEPPPNVG